jgi:hypothetical protein
VSFCVSYFYNLTVAEYFDYIIYVTRFMLNFSVGDGYTIHTHFYMVCSACGISHGYGILIIAGMTILTR